MDISLLVNGEKAFRRIIERIGEAESSIYINMFIWRDDRIGNELSIKLLEAAERGVKIFISKDKLGAIFEKAEENKQSFFHKEFNLNIFLKSTVCDIFYPMSGKAKSKRQKSNVLLDLMLNHSNITVEKDLLKGDHSKYYIFDDKVLIIGGINVEDKEVYTDVEGKKYYDYMVEIKSEKIINKFNNRLFKGEKFDRSNLVDFIFNIDRNGEKIFEAKENILKIISSAKSSIDIVMAYIGDVQTTQKIIEVVKRGITVNMILPEKANIQEDLNKKTLKQIIEATDNKVNIYLSRNMIHAKLIRVDKNLVTLGSINLNKQAMEVLSELNVLINCKDQDFIDTLENSIKDIINNSRKINSSEELKYDQIKALLEVIAC